MRRAFTDTQWLQTESGETLALCMGFDFCAEHEREVVGIRKKLGVPQLSELSENFENQKITNYPKGLVLHEYQWKPKGHRRKGCPAAVLVLVSDWKAHDPSRLLEDAKQELYFVEKYEKGQVVGYQELVCGWDANEFAVHVRGDENVQRLKELYEAMLEGNAVLTLPAQAGFLRKAGLTIGILDRIPQNVQEDYRVQKLGQMALAKALEDTGLSKALAEKGWRTQMRPAWANCKQSGGELEIYLSGHKENFREQLRPGWYLESEIKEFVETGCVFFVKQDLPELDEYPLERFQNGYPHTRKEVVRHYLQSKHKMAAQESFAKDAQNRCLVRILIREDDGGITRKVLVVADLWEDALALAKAEAKEAA